MFLFLVYWESLWPKFIHQTVNCLSARNSFITKFMSELLPTLSSRSLFHVGVIQMVHIVLKYTAPWWNTLLTNCNWERMANGADNCLLLLTNHKQTPMHEAHCSPWNIMPSSGPKVNYFPSFQMLLAIRHTESSAKFVGASQQAVNRSLLSAELWTGQQRKKKKYL
jgi:hypothetical protein